MGVITAPHCHQVWLSWACTPCKKVVYLLGGGRYHAQPGGSPAEKSMWKSDHCSSSNLQPKEEGPDAIVFLASHWCLDRTSVPNQKQFSLIINNVSKAKSIPVFVISMAFQGFDWFFSVFDIFSFTSILSTLKSFPFSYTYSMQCPPLPERNCWSYRLNPVSLIHGTLYPSFPHSHLDWHLNRNIYRQTLYTNRQNMLDSVPWLNMLGSKDQLGSSFAVLEIQTLEIDSLIQDWLRSWSTCCREENGWEPRRTHTLGKYEHLWLMRPITKQVGGGGSKLPPL